MDEWSSRGSGSDLVAFAECVRIALAADAVLIATTATDDILVWASVTSSLVPGRAAVVDAFDAAPAALPGAVVRLDSVRDGTHPLFSVVGAHEFSAAVGTPIYIDGEAVGVLAAYRSGNPLFDEALLRIFARHLSVGIELARAEALVDGPEQRLESLEALERLAISSNTIEELCRGLMENVAPLFESSMIGLLVWHEEAEVLQLLEGSFGASAEYAASCRISVNDWYSNAARVLYSGVPYLNNDSSHDPGILWQFTEAFDIRNLITVPIYYGDRIVGIWNVANKTSPYTITDVQRAQTVAGRVANVLEYAWTMFRMRREAQFESVLLDLAVSIASGDRVGVFMPKAIEQLRDAMGFQLLGLLIDGVPPVMARAPDLPPLAEEQVLGRVSTAADTAWTVAVPRRVGDPGWADLIMPVQLGDDQVAVVVAIRPRAEPFAVDERRILERLGSLSGLAFATDRYHLQRAELARIEERDRLADDLHDDVAQLLFGAQMALDGVLESESASGGFIDLVRHAQSLVVKADGGLRNLIQEWARPPAGQLDIRIESVAAEVSRDFGLPVRVRVTNAGRSLALALAPDSAEAVVRVTREALVNAAKHAGKGRALVTLDADASDKVILSVVDDGVGIDEARMSAGHGLTSLRRMVEGLGGDFRVTRVDPQGSSVVAVLAP